MCIVSCRCPSRVDAVTFLGGVYTQQCKSTHDLDAVVRGHLAILLGEGWGNIGSSDNPGGPPVISHMFVVAGSLRQK